LNPNPPVSNHAATPESHYRLKRSVSAQEEETEPETEDPTTRYVFLSMEDVLEYRDFGSPLQLGSHDLKMREKSFYRNGDDVILTNKVDPNPGFKLDWSGVFGLGQDPNSYITIVMMDMKSAMEEDGLRIAVDLPPGLDSNGESVSVTLDSASVDELMDYEEAVIEMEKKQSSHRNLSHVILGILTLGILSFLILLAYLAYRQIRKRGTYTVNTEKVYKKVKPKSPLALSENSVWISTASESSYSENEDFNSYLDVNYRL